MLIGLGTLGAGAGVFLGSGAFAGEPNRSLRVEFADDSAAYLAIDPVDGDQREHVSVTEGGDGVVSISVDQVNANARTTLGHLVAFSNNSPRTIEELLVEIDDSSRNADLSVTDIPSEIPPGRTARGLGLIVDTRDYAGAPELEATIQIRSVLAPEEAT
jgi:hypothetical protein